MFGKRIAQLVLIVCSIFAFNSPAFAGGAFDGKWTADFDAMTKGIPVFAELKEQPKEIIEEIRNKFEKLYFELDTANKTYVEAFVDTAPNRGSFEILSQTKDELKIRADQDAEILIFTLLDKDHMKMQTQGGNSDEIIYFKR